MLTIELVPSHTWGINVRAVLPASLWRKLSLAMHNNAQGVCQICGAPSKTRNLDCHEIWEYDDTNHIQILTGLISLCPRCHMAKHYGRTQLIGKEKIVIAHMQKVNGWTFMQVKQHHAEMTAQWNEREKYEWQVDVNALPTLMKEVIK